jgi:hypothetical protein
VDTRAVPDKEAGVQPGPEELDAVRDEATAAMGAWGAAAGAWQMVGVVRGSLGAELRPVVEFEGERYMVRRQPPDLHEDDAHVRHAFMRHLRAAGLPVPRLRERPGGGTYAVVAGALYELQEWRGGARYAAEGSDNHQQIARWRWERYIRRRRSSAGVPRAGRSNARHTPSPAPIWT